MLRWLRRLFTVRRPVTRSRQGAVVHTRAGLAISFTPTVVFGGAAPRPARKAPTAPGTGHPWMNALFGPPTKPLTDAQVRALPVVRRAPTPAECRARCATVTAGAADYLAGLRKATGLAEDTPLTRRAVLRARAERDDAAAIAAMQARHAQATTVDKLAATLAPRVAKAQAIQRAPGKKPIKVKAHTRADGTKVHAHTRARAERTK